MAAVPFTVASLDMTSLIEGVEGFQDSLQTLAEDLAEVEPDAVCIRGGTSTAVLRAINGYLVRRHKRLLRIVTTREHPADPGTRHLAVIFRQTNIVARRAEHHGERIALAVNVIDPKVQLVIARAGLDHLELDGARAIVCAPPSSTGPLPEGFTDLPADDGADRIIAKSLAPDAHGLVRTDAPMPVAISWQRVTVE